MCVSFLPRGDDCQRRWADGSNNGPTTRMQYSFTIIPDNGKLPDTELDEMDFADYKQLPDGVGSTRTAVCTVEKGFYPMYPEDKKAKEG